MNQVIKAFGTFLTSEMGKWNTIVFLNVRKFHKIDSRFHV